MLPPSWEPGGSAGGAVRLRRVRATDARGRGPEPPGPTLPFQSLGRVGPRCGDQPAFLLRLIHATNSSTVPAPTSAMNVSAHSSIWASSKPSAWSRSAGFVAEDAGAFDLGQLGDLARAHRHPRASGVRARASGSSVRFRLFVKAVGGPLPGVDLSWVHRVASPAARSSTIAARRATSRSSAISAARARRRMALGVGSARRSGYRRGCCPRPPAAGLRGCSARPRRRGRAAVASSSRSSRSCGADAAGRPRIPAMREPVVLAVAALAARLDGEEPRHAGGDGDEIGGVVEHDEPGRAEARAGRAHVVVAHGRVERAGGQRAGWRRRTAPPRSPGPGGHRRRARRSPRAAGCRARTRRRRHVTVSPLTVHTMVPGESLGAELPEPVGAVADDPGQVGEGLDVAGQRRRRDRLARSGPAISTCAAELDCRRAVGLGRRTPRRPLRGTAARCAGRAGGRRSPRAAPVSSP